MIVLRSHGVASDLRLDGGELPAERAGRAERWDLITQLIFDISMRKLNWKWAAAGFALIFVLWTVIPLGQDIPLANNRSAYAVPATFVRSIGSEASCTITYEPTSGVEGKIELWQDVFDGPILLIQSTNTDILLCLYDYDVDMRLFRIDLANGFRLLSPTSSINNILFSSSWDIQYGTEADWQEVNDYLRTASPKDFNRHFIPAGRFKWLGTQGSVLHSLKYKNLSAE